jgi:two-component system sensor histidine kinase VicK
MTSLDYRLILDALGDAVVASDGANRIVYANPAAERLLGWPAGELVGRPITTIQPERMRAMHLAGFHRYVSTHAPKIAGHAVRVPALRRDGTEIDVELTLTMSRDSDGEDLIVASLRALPARAEHAPNI